MHRDRHISFGDVRRFGVLECVVNISEGRDATVLDQLVLAAGPDMLDMHIEHGVWGGTSERQRQRMRRGLHLIGAQSAAGAQAS